MKCNFTKNSCNKVDFSNLNFDQALIAPGIVYYLYGTVFGFVQASNMLKQMLNSKYFISASLLFFLICGMSFGQDAQTEEMTIDGEIVSVLIEDSDTLILATLDDVSIASPRNFESKEEYRYYKLTRARAAKVYPYAVKAIEVFRDVEEYRKDHKKKDNKKYIKSLHKRLKSEFQQPLKNLSRKQGAVLVEMIERELGLSTFQLIKSLKGGFKAVYWNNAAKFFGYRLKRGYDPTADPILEMVLSTYDISHETD